MEASRGREIEEAIVRANRRERRTTSVHALIKLAIVLGVVAAILLVGRYMIVQDYRDNGPNPIGGPL